MTWRRRDCDPRGGDHQPLTFASRRIRAHGYKSPDARVTEPSETIVCGARAIRSSPTFTFPSIMLDTPPSESFAVPVAAIERAVEEATRTAMAYYGATVGNGGRGADERGLPLTSSLSMLDDRATWA